VLRGCYTGIAPTSRNISTEGHCAINSSLFQLRVPTTAQISSLLSITEEYFSVRTVYQKGLFDEIIKSASSSLVKRELADSEYKIQEILLPLFQNFFSSREKLNLSQLTTHRNLLWRIKALDKGRLSGSVWLYSSHLSSFAISELVIIDPKLIKASLEQAEAHLAKHHYADAEKIYRNLLNEYDASPQGSRIKALLTRCVVDGYNYQADQNLERHRFEQARTYLHKIIDTYPRTEYADAARKKLEETVSVAVRYYHTIAKKNFQPLGHIGIAQNKAAIYYKRMYEENKKGPMASLALYYWARALGTEGKVKQEVKLLQQHLVAFPHSEVRSRAMYLLGFTYCNNQLRDYKRGIPLLLQVAADFSRDKVAPEALWNAAYILGWEKQYAKAIPLLQQLKRQYPDSPRAKWVDQWIAKYQEEV